MWGSAAHPVAGPEDAVEDLMALHMRWVKGQQSVRWICLVHVSSQACKKHRPRVLVYQPPKLSSEQSSAMASAVTSEMKCAIPQLCMHPQTVPCYKVLIACDLPKCCRWVEDAGGHVECPEGVEVSPLVSYAGEGLEELCHDRTFTEPYDLALQGAAAGGCSGGGIAARTNVGGWFVPLAVGYVAVAAVAAVKAVGQAVARK